MTDAPDHTGQPRWADVLNGGAAVLAVLAFGMRLVATNDRSDWGYAAAEWLTNYDSGVVRRGLGGEVLSWFGMVPQKWTLIALVSVIFTAVVVGQALVVAKACRRLGNPWPLLVWLVPGGPLLANLQTGWQPIPAFVDQFAFRKEYLGYVIMLAVALLLLNRPDLIQRRLLPVAATAGLVLAVASFTHEALVMPATAAIGAMILFGPEAPTRRRVWAVLLVAVPAAVVSLAFVLTGPSAPGSAALIIGGIDTPTQEWLGGHDSLMAGSPYNWLEMTAQDGIAFTRDTVFVSGAWRGWLLVGCLALAFGVVAAWLADSRRQTLRSRVVGLLAIGLVTAPLFIVGADTGRWISAVIFLSLNTSLVLSSCRTSPVVPQPSRALVIAGIVLAVLVLAAGLPETGDPSGLLLGRRG